MADNMGWILKWPFKEYDEFVHYEQMAKYCTVQGLNKKTLALLLDVTSLLQQ